MRIAILSLCLVLCIPLTAGAQAAPEPPQIDVVFAIDCSGSMGGVIETAKQKVWAIVNEVAKAKPAPKLRIGLIGYGNSMGPFRTFPLTDDLDEVYKNLMTFKDEGWGSEFVGLAVHRATDEMQWGQGKQVLKVIYVVGNETARQGPGEFDYAKTAPAAIAKDIVVNAIYCGNTDYERATPTWREMARLADGEYMEIAAQGGAITIATPYDAELASLNARLNATYLAYGAAGETRRANQAAQDANAERMGQAVAAERAVAKSAPLYDARTWDLVDAMKDPAFDLSKIPEDQLPAELRKVPAEQRLAWLQAKAREREDVRRQIKELAEKREQFIREEVQKRGLSGDQAFDEAVKRSITKQAQKKGFEFEPVAP